MIRLTRLSGMQFVLNCDLIERIDQTPDTVVTLGDGTKYIVAESIDDVLVAIRQHRAEIIALSDHVSVTTLDRPQAELASVTQLTAPHGQHPDQYPAPAHHGTRGGEN